MNRRPRQTHQSVAKLTGKSLLLPLFLGFAYAAYANDPAQESPVGGTIETPIQVESNTTANVDQQKEQVNKEQEALATKNRDELELLAKNGERLAQIALGNDFANEAQQILFAPAAANSAISDALAWYSLAAQRGYPGTPSLDSSGVKFHPVRVIRNH